MSAARQPRLTLIRASALTYDLFLMCVPWALATFIALRFAGAEAIEQGVGKVLFQGWLLTVAGLYFVYSWVRGGQTLGMRAWRLMLVDSAGARPGALPALVRFGVCAGVTLAAVYGAMLVAGTLGLVAAGVDLAFSLLDREGRSLGDRASGLRMERLPPGEKRSLREAAGLSGSPPPPPA